MVRLRWYHPWWSGPAGDREYRSAFRDPQPQRSTLLSPEWMPIRSQVWAPGEKTVAKFNELREEFQAVADKLKARVARK